MRDDALTTAMQMARDMKAGQPVMTPRSAPAVSPPPASPAPVATPSRSRPAAKNDIRIEQRVGQLLQHFKSTNPKASNEELKRMIHDQMRKEGIQ